MDPRFTFITSYETDYSRSGVLLTYLSKKGLVSGIIKFDSWRAVSRFALQILKENRKTDYYIVMNPSQFLTPIVRLLTLKQIVLDSGWPLTEKSKHKNISVTQKLQRVKSWVTDFASMHLANLVLLESNLQKEKTSQRFKISKNKLEVSFTGVDEVAFTQGVGGQKNINDKFMVGFRGRYNLEAGLEILAETTRISTNDDISFLVITSKMPESIKFGENTILKNKSYASKERIVDLLSSCDVLLGQLSDHPRLNVTIPHKAFEAAIMGKPYLSARASGIQEFLVEGVEAEYFVPGDPVDLLNKIEKLRSDKDYRRLLGENILKKYKVMASEEAIGDNFLKLLKKH
jgi:glycosyltransferase involved in cell wall biosynthesis